MSKAHRVVPESRLEFWHAFTRRSARQSVHPVSDMSASVSTPT